MNANSTLRSLGEVAYLKGWQASKSTITADLDRAEQNYIRKNGSTFLDYFTRGWVDYSSGNSNWVADNEREES